MGAGPAAGPPEVEMVSNDLVQAQLNRLSQEYEEQARSIVNVPADAAPEWDGDTPENRERASKFMRERMTAYDKASMQLSTMTRPMVEVQGRLLIPSRTQGDRVYRVTPVSCNCEAGFMGKFCWHQALAEAYIDARDRQAEPPAPTGEVLDIGLPPAPVPATVDALDDL